MKMWKIAICLVVLPMISLVGISGNIFSIDWLGEVGGNASVPYQELIQTAVIKQVNIGSYYCINNSVAIETTDLNSISAKPLFYYNNASNKDLTFKLNSSASIGVGLNDVCTVFVMSSEGNLFELTNGAQQSDERPANETEYYLCIKYLKQEGRCKTTIEVS
jgi:hypothetical protein